QSLEEQLVEVAKLLQDFGDEVDDIEASDDVAAKRYIIERMVTGICARTIETGTKCRRGMNVQVTYAFSPPVVAEELSPTTTSRRSSPTGGPTATSGRAEP